MPFKTTSSPPKILHLYQDFGYILACILFMGMFCSLGQADELQTWAALSAMFYQ